MKRRFPRSSTVLPVVLAFVSCGGSARLETEPTPSIAVAPAPVEPRTIQLTEAEVRAIAELLLMEDRRIVDRTRIAALVDHWSAEVRRRAVLAIGRTHDVSSVPLLLGALNDPVDAVRVEAAFALGLVGDTSAHVITALAELLPEHSGDSIGVEAGAALARAGTPAARSALVDLLTVANTDAPSPSAREALLALWRTGRDLQDIISLPGRFLASTDADVRWRAAYPLIRTGLPSAIPLLLPLAGDPDAAVRSLVVRALRSPATDSAGVRETAIATLRTATADSAAEVRINAAGAMATYRNPALTEELAALLGDDDGNVRMAAVQAVAAIRDPAAGPELARIASDENERIGIRVAAIGGLSAVDQGAALTELRRWAASDRWLERFFAARSLGALDRERAGSMLATLARDAEERVAVAAISSVSRSDTGTAGRALFLERLQARNVRVRAAAIAGLGRLASPSDLSTLMDAYETAADDTLTDAAVAAVVALGALKRAGVPVENAFFTRFAAHGDADVRSQVERRIGAGWNVVDGRVEPTRGAGFYEDIVRRLVVPALAGVGRPVLVFDGPTGRIEVALAASEAPLTVHNIMKLIDSGYFDGSDDQDSRRWHRVVPNFVLQDGEPNGDGSGGPGYAIRDEINRLRYGRGTLGMALSGPDTGGSQFFITHSPQPHLDGGYTVFGSVVSGMEAANRVVQDDRVGTMEIVWR